MGRAILRIGMDRWMRVGPDIRRSLGLPEECRVLGYSVLFADNQIALEIEDPSFADSQLPEVTASYVDGEFSHWSGSAVQS